MFARRHSTASLLALALAACSGAHEPGADGGQEIDSSLDAAPRADTGPSACSVRAAPVCEPGPAVCGNGVADSCPECHRCGDAGVCCTPRSEPCDGSDLGGATCASVGYGGGTLACEPGCTFAVRGCDPCNHDPRIAACRRAGGSDGGASSLALATAADGTVALAWVTNGTTLHFARVDESLGLVGERVVGEPPCVGGQAAEVLLASADAGWFLSASTGERTNLFVLDAAGSVRAAPAPIVGVAAFDLAARPGGPPLLVAGTFDRVEAILLDGAGGVVTRTPLFSPSFPAERGSTVWVGDGFLSAVRAENDVAIARIEADGRLTRTTVVGDGETEAPQLAWTGTGARITWSDFTSTPTMFWQALDHAGQPTSPAVALGAPGENFARAPIGASGQDSLVLLPGYSGLVTFAERVAVVRLGPTGAPLGSELRVDAQPSGHQSWALVSHGGGAVVAWLDPTLGEGVVLARVDP